MNTLYREGQLSYLLIFLFLINTTLSAQVKHESPLLTLHANNQRLRDILQDISNQSEIQFVFYDGLVEGKYVSCNIKNMSMEKALREILEPTGLGFQLMPDALIVLHALREKSPHMNTESTDLQTTPPILQSYEDIQPDYPRLAQRNGFEGTVNMNLFVTESGEVKYVKIIRSSGYKILDYAAEAFVKKSKFNPAKRGNEPIDAWISWSLHYKLIERDVLTGRYVQSIRGLRGKANKSEGAERSRILKEILTAHIEFVEFSKNKPELDLNQTFKEIVRHEIYKQWKFLWLYVPLRFVVFQDFVLRYPNSEGAITAKHKLLDYLKSDMNLIERSIADHSIRREEVVDTIEKMKKQIGLSVDLTFGKS